MPNGTCEAHTHFIDRLDGRVGRIEAWLERTDLRLNAVSQEAAKATAASTTSATRSAAVYELMVRVQNKLDAVGREAVEAAQRHAQLLMGEHRRRLDSLDRIVRQLDADTQDLTHEQLATRTRIAEAAKHKADGELEVARAAVRDMQARLDALQLSREANATQLVMSRRAMVGTVVASAVGGGGLLGLIRLLMNLIGG